MLKYRYTDIFSDIYNQAGKIATNEYGFNFSKPNPGRDKSVDRSYFDNLDEGTSINIDDKNSLLGAGTYSRKGNDIYKDNSLIDFNLNRQDQRRDNIRAGFDLGTDVLGSILSQRKRSFNYTDELNKQRNRQNEYDYVPSPYNPYGYNASLQNNRTLYAESGLDYNVQEEQSFIDNIYDDNVDSNEDKEYNQMMNDYYKEINNSLGYDDAEQELSFINDLLGEEMNSTENDYPSFLTSYKLHSNSKYQEAVNYLTNSKDLPSHIAKGIVANLMAESNLDPNAVGDSGKAKGLAQWHPDRYLRLSSSGFDLNNFYDSLNAIVHELNTTERTAKEKLFKTSNAKEATDVFLKHFERAKNTNPGSRYQYIQ